MDRRYDYRSGGGSGGGQGDADGTARSPEEALEQLRAPIIEDSFLGVSNRKTWLFTYDDLLSPASLSRFVKGVTLGKLAQIPSAKLVFPYYYPPRETALASLEFTGQLGSGVWGMIYDVTKKDLTLLERHLYVPNRYHRRSINVIDRGGQRMAAFTYVLSVSGGEPLLPSQAYRDAIVQAATELSLPDDWLGHLMGLSTISS